MLPTLVLGAALALSAPCPAATNTCIDLAIRSAVPAKLEWSYWTGGGVATQSWRRGAGASGSVGGDLTFGVARFPGFPAGRSAAWNAAELRLGPWFSAAVERDGGLVEGGVELKLGAVYHASWGTYDLRTGSGYGAALLGRGPYVTVTLGWGIRSVPKRYSVRGFCDPEPKPAATALASVARLVVTLRSSLSEAREELLIGIELSPTLFIPRHVGPRTSAPTW